MITNVSRPMIQVTTYTEVGGKQQNEDAFLVGTHPSDSQIWLCALADGIGGQSGGARAAQLACETVIEQAITIPTSALFMPNTWQNILEIVDHTVATDSSAGLTTLIGCVISPTQIAGASVGDSAIKLFCGQQVTDITAKQRKNPTIGAGNAIITPFSHHLNSVWKILLMSDGVWKYIGHDQLIESGHTTSGESLIQQLRKQAALPRTGQLQDDFTVVVCELNQSESV